MNEENIYYQKHQRLRDILIIYLSCTCVKSLKLWIAFVPNILEKNQNTSSSLMQFIWKISQKHAILHMSAASHLAGNIGQLLDPGTLALE